MRAVLFLLCCSFLSAALAQSHKDRLTEILESEIKREMEEFAKAPTPPYYIDYRITDIRSDNISATFGSLTHSGENKDRYLSTRVRIGNYTFDNTHPLKERPGFFPLFSGGNYVSIEDNEDQLRYELWRATQSDYRQALEQYKVAKNAQASTADKSEQEVADFSQEPKVQSEVAKDPGVVFDRELWNKKVKDFSALFLSVKGLVENNVSLRVSAERKYFVSSEGTSVVQNTNQVYLNIAVRIRAEDGDLLPLHRTFFAPDLSALPSDQAITEEIKYMIALLEQLKKAPLAEPYSGPALLESRVAGVFFHEIFGHRIEGHRLKSDQDGQTFRTQIGEAVLPASLSVYFDPTVNQFEGKFLNGSYSYDDEGIKARRVDVVEKGILKTFLMSRTPLDKIAHSNGHGRAANNTSPVSRQSNLFVQTSKPKTTNDLRQQLIKECKKQGKKYGYLFRDVVGGFTLTGRSIPNAFNIFPTEVYRVYVDGRKDELVRGVDLIGTPLAMFAEIVSAGDRSDLFTGFCGAESGYVPVSAIAPALFVRRIETQKKPKSNQEEPILSSPTSKDNN